MAKIVKLKDRESNNILPITMSTVVEMNEGISVEEKFENIDQTLSNKETSYNKVTSFDSSSTDTEYPSAKAVNDKFISLDGTANIASINNNIVTIKSGISEEAGIISNSTGSDIILHKIASTGSPDDITVKYNHQNVSLSNTLTSIKSGIDTAQSTGTQYIVSGSISNTPNITTFEGSQGTLVPSSTTTGKVYLVPNDNESYTQYVTKQSGSSYQWTSLGSTTVDLTGVVKIISMNGKQYAVAEGTTFVDLGDVIKEITTQSSITNANTDYVHITSTTSKNAATGNNTVSLSGQLKTGDINANTSGVAIIENIKPYIDSKIVIRTWTNS